MLKLKFDVDMVFGTYMRCLNWRFISQDIGGEQVEKKKTVLLCAIGAKTFSWLVDLTTLSSMEKNGNCLVDVLKTHLGPEKYALFRCSVRVRLLG